MQAVAYLAPVIAPLALRIIDKFIFDDRPNPVPQIIQIPAPSQCLCCCGRQLTDEYDIANETCSTCTSRASWFRDDRRSTNRHRLFAGSSVRSSSTGDSYEKKKCRESPRARSTTRMTDRGAGMSEKKSYRHDDNEDTLAILAVRLKKEISSRESKMKTASRGTDSRSANTSSASKYKSLTSARMSSSRDVQETKSSTRRSKCNSGAEAKVLKSGRCGC